MISIVLPCYRSENCISAMIDDILAQTFSDWELIVVSNGASQELQLQVIGRYAAKDDRIRLLSVPEGGVSNARNVGLSVARGEWITFVDADDRLNPDHLQLYLDAASDGTDVVCGGYEVCRVSESRSEKFSVNAMTTRQDGLSEVLSYLIRTFDFIVSSPCNKLYSAQAVRGILFDTGITYCEDRIFNLQILNRSRSVNVIPLTGYRYMVNGGSATSRYHASFDLSSDQCMALEHDLRIRIGQSQSEADHWALDTLYIRTYFKICNLFKAGSPLSFCQKVGVIRGYLSDGNVFRSFSMQDTRIHNKLLLLYDLSLMLHSSLILACSFSVQYFIKNHLGSVRGRIMHSMRRNSY